MELKNKRWEEAELMDRRVEVLSGWVQGSKVDLEEAISYHRRLPANKISSYKLEQGKKLDKVYLQPRAGVALLKEHLELLKYLEECGGADFLPTTIDSYTRQNRYREAELGIEASKKAERSLLNGFPAVNYGVEACRSIIETMNIPVQVRHGTPDARLLAEITLAAGFTDFEGGGISYNIPYAKDIPLEKSLLYWQYVDRLAGYYQEHGAPINREPFGPLTGTLVPPCISHAIGIIEALLAAEQGVKSISLGYGQCGNLLQDVAAIHTLKELGETWLHKFGFYDVQLTTVLHQWMGGFPQEEPKAFGVICWGAVTAAFSKANKVIVKTPHEALGIPTKQANCAGMLATRQILNMLCDQVLPVSEEIEEEKEIIRQETNFLLEKVLELGSGDLLIGTVNAFKAGVLDVPFAPSRFNAGKAMPVRDNNGAVRFLKFGNIPFPESIKDFHRRKIAERGEKEQRLASFKMVTDDIYAIGKGMLVGRPK